MNKAKNNRSRALILTLLIHGLLFIVLFFLVITVPIPPFPDAAGGNGGVLVNIGYIDLASGEIQPMSENIADNPTPFNAQPQPSEDEEKVATQDLEDAPLVKTSEKKIVKKHESNLTKPTVKPLIADEKVNIPVRVADAHALYKGKNTNSVSQGTASTGAGDQGAQDGDPYSNNYGKSGTGTGNGDGNGNGSGNGEETGSGNGKGSGTSFELRGRKIMHKPNIEDKSQETGKVVVSIIVDKKGNVVDARPGARGTTTTSDYLLKKAREAAMKAKFSPNPDAPEEQKGTISFTFLVE